MSMEIKDGVLVKYTGTDKNIVVPEGVKEIGYSAFLSLTADDIDSISLPDSLEDFSLDLFAYDETDKIADKLEDENGFIILGSWFVAYRGNQNTVTLPTQVRHICKDAFNCWENGCSVSIIHLNEGLEDIGEEAFHGSDVEEVVLPSSLKRIAARAFWECNQLTKIDVPDSVQMDPLAFLTCSGLTDERGLLIVDGKLISIHVQKKHSVFHAG